jgi:hypothetical protein
MLFHDGKYLAVRIFGMYVACGVDVYPIIRSAPDRVVRSHRVLIWPRSCSRAPGWRSRQSKSRWGEARRKAASIAHGANPSVERKAKRTAGTVHFPRKVGEGRQQIAVAPFGRT